MEVVAALLCDAANVREGLLNVISAGVTRLWRPTVPAPLGVTLALVMELDVDEIRLPHEVQVTITNDFGPVASITGAFQAGTPLANPEPGELFLAPFPADLRMVLTAHHGRHQIDVSIDVDAAERRLSFWVLHPEEMSLPPWEPPPS